MLIHNFYLSVPSTRGIFVGSKTCRGIAYKYKGEFNRATTDYSEALRIDPNNAFAKQRLEELQKRKLIFDW